jgi:hypothetical protein
VTIREWWDGSVQWWWGVKSCAVEQKNARLAIAALQQGVSAARGLRSPSDDQLIAQVVSRSSLSARVIRWRCSGGLKDSIEGPD